jgi:hypothetical protein
VQDDSRKEAMSDKPWEKFRMEGQLRPPAGSKILFAKFLPITNVNNTQLMNRFLVAADNKGTIHVFNSDGQHLAEKSTGHSGSITALAVDFRPSINYHVVTGSSNGEVKIWSIAAPERPGGRGGTRASQNGTNSSSLSPSSPGKETGGRTSNSTTTVGRSNVTAAGAGRGRIDMKVQWAQWQPAWKLEAEFSPSSVDAVRGISRRYHMVDMTQEGQKPITLIDFVPKGRNFNLLVADGIGRMSMHLKNGTLSSSVMLPGSGAPRCSSIFKTVAAICTGGGIALYEVKERKLLTATCTRHVPTDDSLPEWKPTAANQGGNSSQHRKRTRFPPQPIVADFVSYAQDVTQEHIAYAGTADGRFMVLNVRQEKTRVRCTLSNEVRVSARADTQVHVASTKGYMYVASSSAKGSTTITAYNSTGMTRSFPPEIALQVVIRDSSGGKQGAIMYGDRHAGLVLTVGGSAALISARLETENHPPSSDRLYSGLGITAATRRKERKHPQRKSANSLPKLSTLKSISAEGNLDTVPCVIMLTSRQKHQYESQFRV